MKKAMIFPCEENWYYIYWSSMKSGQDQLAVTEKMSALLTVDYLKERSKRGSRQKFEAVLATVPDVEPEEFDRW